MLRCRLEKQPMLRCYKTPWASLSMHKDSLDGRLCDPGLKAVLTVLYDTAVSHTCIALQWLKSHIE